MRLGLVSVRTTQYGVGTISGEGQDHARLAQCINTKPTPNPKPINPYPNHKGHTKRRRDDGTDDGTTLDDRCAAVMCPVVMLYGKL